MANRKIDYIIEVSYPAEEYPRLDKFYEQLVGRRSVSSGLGFGRRDISWYTKSKAVCKRLVNKLKKNLQSGVDVDSTEERI